MEEKIIIILITIFLITSIYCKSNKIKNTSIDYTHIYDYIIIGSGPAGLQAGYYLEKFNKDYLILEKSNSNGSFFKKYPIH